MDQIKHQDGKRLSAEDTAKLNEISTWLSDHGYHGFMFINNGDVGVTWLDEKSSDAIRHDIISAVSHLALESEEAAVMFVLGMVMAIKQLKKA